MAKNTQEAEVIVTLNGTAAKKAVAELAQEFDRLQKEALEAYKAGNDALGKKLDAQAQKLMKDIEITRRETKKFADVMKNINGASLKELNSAAKQLRSEINKLTPGTQEFITKSKQLQEVNTRINQLKGSFKGLVAEEKAATITLKGLSEGFNRYFGMITAGIAAITGVSMALKKCAQDAAAMDDAYATVMKTTSLTHEEVEQLNDSFKRMDTRTAREELNKMAYEAGKLGFTGVENIRQFVEAADVINVALGDVLGEGATLEIAKLAQVFAQSTAALDNLDLKGRMLAVGSAVNQLGKESTASESYMVDFLGRLGGVATQAGISADQILGYASALDQMKQKVEMSATAFQKLIQQMIKKPEEFVEAARMPLEDFQKMMETDMNGAIKRVLEGFNGMGGFTQLVPVFKDMGLDGARAASVIAALAANLDKVSAAQETANEHIRLGTSMTREYTIMNTSMQAKLEKARKEFKDICIELGQRLNPVMLKSTKGVTYLIKVLATYGKEIGAAIIAVVAFTAAVKASAIMQGTYNVALKATNALMNTWKAITWAVRVAYYKMIGAQEAATIAQQQLNAAMSSNVFGLMATAVAMATVAIARFVKKQREAAEAADWEKKVEQEATKAYAEQAATVTTLTKIINSNNVSLESRKKALDELKKIVPEYHADLTEEGKLIHNNTEALTQYIAELRRSARIKARREDIETREKELMELEDQLEAARAREAKAQANMTPAKMWEMQNLTDYEDPIIEEYEAATAAREALENQVNSLSTTQEQAMERLGKLTQINTDGLTAEQAEIAAVKKEYEDLFQTIRDENMFTPGGGEDLIAEKRIELQKKIAEIRLKYKLTETDEADPGPGGGSGLTEKEAKKAFDARIKAIQQQYKTEERELKLSLLRKQNELKKSLSLQEIDQAEYESRLAAANAEYESRLYMVKAEYFSLKIDAARQYCQDETEIMNEFYDWQIQAIEKSNKQQQEIMDALAKANRARKKKEEDDQLKEMQNLGKRLADEQEILENDLARVKERIGEDTWKEELAFEMWKLEELHDQGIISERNYQMAKLKIRMEYAQKAAEGANQFAEQASNFVTQLKEMESAQLEAEYQKQLTAAGDNAEEREAIEAEYEQKKLDLQKKYADTEMVINIAKAIAAGALAAIEAFAAAGNPILGAVFAAIIAATTALEVATIVKQRNAIKNTSVGGGGSSSAPKTGERKMTGYAEGGYTEDHTTLTTVGEKGREWVGPAWMVRKNPVMFANLERYRKSGSHGRSGSMSRGFADGGFTPGKGGGPSAAMPAQIDIEAAVEAAIRRVMDDGAIRAYVVRKDIEELDAQTLKFKKLGSR